MESIHIWDGFFDDIFRAPAFDGSGWLGFTRDYHQCEGAFGDTGEYAITNLQEYIDDLKIYEGRQFDYPETRDAYSFICNWLNKAQKRNCSRIIVKVF